MLSFLSAPLSHSSILNCGKFTVNIFCTVITDNVLVLMRQFLANLNKKLFLFRLCWYCIFFSSLILLVSYPADMVCLLASKHCLVSTFALFFPSLSFCVMASTTVLLHHRISHCLQILLLVQPQIILVTPNKASSILFQ